jgi:hypothetical protein
MACDKVAAAYKDSILWRISKDVPRQAPELQAAAVEVEVIQEEASEVEAEFEISESALAVPNVFEGHRVRFVGSVEQPEWVAADVVAILHPESSKKDRSNYLKSIPSDWRGNRDITTPGGQQNMTTVFEPGL